MINDLLDWLFGKARHGSSSTARPAILATPDTRPVPLAPPTSVDDPELAPVKNWSHPFRDKRDPLVQLTHMANANAGYYPMGRNGLWHGGIHFDSGTAGGLDQSSVHCLADGEVIAYRVDTHSPTTQYLVNKLPVNKPFSRNFVLVRHRLQPPKIEGNADTPPRLIFYSLYMHLQDWAVYQEDPAQDRPAFWPQSSTHTVRHTNRDVLPEALDQPGLNVRNRVKNGSVLSLLPRGASVTISGEGDYRKLENTLGPDFLQDAEGTLQGYLPFAELQPLEGGDYRLRNACHARAEASVISAKLGRPLPSGTVVAVSGEGAYRKLERVDQYVHFKSLQSWLEPLVLDEVVVLDTPVAIKAGELIGHIGLYQDYNVDRPEQKLHLEVFACENVKSFIASCRLWAEKLPAGQKTWLKFAKGTAVVTHQSRFGKVPPTLHAEHTLSGADLSVPRSLLDALPGERKITVAATPDRKACNWYRLDGLLSDADNALLDGWVREEVGITPWTTPWHWDGFEVIYDYTSTPQLMASLLRASKRLTDAQLERYGPMADEGDKGPIKKRLYSILDRDGDGTITAKEVRETLRIPAHAQSVSRIVIRYESEWLHKPQKWDSLDEMFGHSGSTPHTNFFAEKKRIGQLGWWENIAHHSDLPDDGYVFYFHPLGLISNLGGDGKCSCGRYLGPVFETARYGSIYGPVYWGSLELKDYKGWASLILQGRATDEDKRILIAMSANEGRLDSLQSYDSEILTAGAMQKTINIEGGGELPVQIFQFREEYPELYASLFESCGWEIHGDGRNVRIFYQGVTGEQLRTIIREGFNQEKRKAKAKTASAPLAAFLHAITSEEFLAKQVVDFVERLRLSLSVSPRGHGATVIGDYLRSSLGKAVVLDQHVNRPGFVSTDFGRALDVFFDENPQADRHPSKWASDHDRNENSLIEIYSSRRRMTDSIHRYDALKERL